MGYDVVHVEVQNHKPRTLRVFIDFAEQTPELDNTDRAIGIEDCVKVTRALEEPLEKLPEVESIFHGTYELEVSSPGVDRPLRTARDFTRFAGREARIHTFRPLTAEESGNASYQERNPKQKNYFGTILGMNETAERVRFEIALEGSAAGKAGAVKGKKPAKKEHKKSKADSVASAEIVTIPLLLISKANLEPRYEFDGEATEIEADETG